MFHVVFKVFFIDLVSIFPCLQCSNSYFLFFFISQKATIEVPYFHFKNPSNFIEGHACEVLLV